jgi:hypothetical protein
LCSLQSPPVDSSSHSFGSLKTPSLNSNIYPSNAVKRALERRNESTKGDNGSSERRGVIRRCNNV